MTHKAAYRDDQARRERLNTLRRRQDVADRRPRWLVVTTWVVAVLAVTGILAGMMATSRPSSTSSSRPAPGFSLTDTSGATVNLGDFRGKNVLLYFNEGAGCQSCLVQMAEIEKHSDHLEDLDLTVLPIVMNSREQITLDMAANGVRTPFLLDDGTVSEAYGTLGKGMHAGLPGHSFVLVDGSGTQRWYGEYPSMWLAPEDLFDEVTSRLAA